MQTMTKSWTDERLEERFDRIEDRFDAVDRQFQAVDKRFDAVDQRFPAIDQRFDRVEADIRELRSEMKVGFDAMQRTLNRFGGGMILALLALIATQL
jgi:predicted  nucleic acid-binding Zn-ribbon protein